MIDGVSRRAKVVCFAKDEPAAADLLRLLGEVRTDAQGALVTELAVVGTDGTMVQTSVYGVSASSSFDDIGCFCLDADLIVLQPVGLRATEWVKRVHSLSLSARIFLVESTPGLASLLKVGALPPSFDRATFMETMRSVLFDIARTDVARSGHVASVLDAMKAIVSDPPRTDGAPEGQSAHVEDDTIHLDQWSTRARLVVTHAQAIADDHGHAEVTLHHCALALAQSAYALRAFVDQFNDLARAESSLAVQVSALPRTHEPSSLGRSVLTLIAEQEVELHFRKRRPSIKSLAVALSERVGFSPSSGWPDEDLDALVEKPFFASTAARE